LYQKSEGLSKENNNEEIEIGRGSKKGWVLKQNMGGSVSPLQ